MPDFVQCDQGGCGYDLPVTATVCPHCGRPGRFPNVVIADLPKQRSALEARYLDAQQSVGDETRSVLDGFERAVKGSQAVVARSFEEVARLATSDRELYATYYQLRSLRLPSGREMPTGVDWDRVREVADTAVFGKDNVEQVRFAALSLDGRGLTSYGECSVVLKESLTSYRASVFEENSVLFMQRRRIAIWDELPPGFRSTWRDRGKLAVAKLAGKLSPATGEQDFATILLRAGKTTAEDEFIEVHVFGPLTIRAIAKVIVDTAARDLTKDQLATLRELLRARDVELELRS